MAGIWIPKRLVEISLINLAAMQPQAFVRQCETEYDRRLEDTARAILASGRHLVMLTGPSGSGKTTSANRLAALLQQKGLPSQVISLDNFYLNGEDYPTLPDGSKDYESVYALDIPCINRCLSQVVATGKTLLPQFDFARELRKPQPVSLDIQGGVLIVEGIHAHNPILLGELPPENAFRLYVGLREEYSYQGRRILPTRDVRLARRMVRDARHRNRTPLQTLAMWPGVCENEDRCMRKYKPQADHILDTSFSYEIECLASQLIALAAPYVQQEQGDAHKLQELIDDYSLCCVPMQQYLPRDSMLQEFFS